MNTIEKTTEEVKNAIINNRIKYLNHHKCDLCGIYTRYIFEYDDLNNLKILYNFSCDCTISKIRSKKSQLRKVDLEELTNFINDKRMLSRINAIHFNEELRFGEVYFNDLALKELETLNYHKVSQKELEKTVTEYVLKNKESLDFSKEFIRINDIPFEHIAVVDPIKKEDFTLCKGTHIGVKLFNSKIRYVQYIESFYTTKKEE
jgi:hypothetical protein